MEKYLLLKMYVYNLDSILNNFSITRLLLLICKSFGNRLFCHIIVQATGNAVFYFPLRSVLEDAPNPGRNYVRFRGQHYT